MYFWEKKKKTHKISPFFGRLFTIEPKYTYAKISLTFEGWAQDCSNSNIFLKPLFKGNFDPFVNNANSYEQWHLSFHCLQKEML